MELGPYTLGPAGANMGIYQGDALALGERIPAAAGVSMIFCDPLYSELAHYAWLARLALRVLPAGAPLLAWASGPKAPAVVMTMQAAGLRFVQPFYYTTMGKTHALAGYKTMCKTTPLLWFALPGRLRRPAWWIADTYQDNTPPDSTHVWCKNLGVTRYYLEPFTSPGELVLDPFTGHGTVPAACKETGRLWLAFELAQGRAATARRRVAATPYRPALFDPAPAQLCMDLAGDPAGLLAENSEKQREGRRGGYEQDG